MATYRSFFWEPRSCDSTAHRWPEGFWGPRFCVPHSLLQKEWWRAWASVPSPRAFLVAMLTAGSCTRCFVIVCNMVEKPELVRTSYLCNALPPMHAQPHAALHTHAPALSPLFAPLIGNSKNTLSRTAAAAQAHKHHKRTDGTTRAHKHH